MLYRGSRDRAIGGESRPGTAGDQEKHHDDGNHQVRGTGCVCRAARKPIAGGPELGGVKFWSGNAKIMRIRA